MPVALLSSAASGSGPELRELRYFASVARAGNLGRAALELGITPPAIGPQLRKLEEKLGTRLLIRHGRGVTLTPSGACLLERLDTIMHLLAAPLAQDDATTPMCGAVSVALPAEVGPLLLPVLVGEFRSRWPQVTLDVREGVSGTVESWVLGRTVDVALVQDPADLDELRSESLVTEPLGVVVSPRSAIAESDRPLRLRDIEQLPLILSNPRHHVRRLLARACFQRGVQINAAFQIDSVSLIKSMVRGGLGCTVLPGVAVREELDRGTLVFRPIEQPSLATTYAIALRHASQDQAVLGCVAILRDVIGSLVARGAWLGAQVVKSPAKSSVTDTGQSGRLEAGQLPVPAALQRNTEILAGD